MKNARRVVAISCLGIGASFAPPAISKEVMPEGAHELSKLEAEVKALTKAPPKGKDAAAQFDAFMTFLGLNDTCPAGDCKTIASAKWTTANLDEDAADEKILAITTTGAGACASLGLTVLVFDSTPKGWVLAARKTFRSEGAKPVADLSVTHVHASTSKDLVVHLDGQCKGKAREQTLEVLSLSNGHLAEVVESKDFVGTGLLSYTLSGAAPVAIELTDAKGKTKLLYDTASQGYDLLPPYADALKTSVTKSDDHVLSISECAAPLTGAMAGECKLTGAAKLQVLVQHGKAIGLTVSVTPERPSFVRCMRKAVATTSWLSTAAASGCTRTFAVK